MKIFHQNICGLFSKFHNLQELFDRHTSICIQDILTLSETHIIDGEYDDNEGLFQVPSYTFLKHNQQAGKGVGWPCLLEMVSNGKGIMIWKIMTWKACG